MKCVLTVVVLLELLSVAHGASSIHIVSLDVAEPGVLGAAFSPNSHQLAFVVRKSDSAPESAMYVLRAIELPSMKTVAESEIGPTAGEKNFRLQYSSGGRYLLIGAEGTDTVSIRDGKTLQSLHEILLHTENRSRQLLGSHYIKGVVSIAAARNNDIFGVLTGAAPAGPSDVFVGSFGSGRIVQRFSLGEGGSADFLGKTGISFTEDGAKLVASILPIGKRIPKSFANLRLFNPLT